MTKFKVALRIKKEQLNFLQEKLQAANLEVLHWKNQKRELYKKKEESEKEIALSRKEGFLKHISTYDEFLLFLEKELFLIEKKLKRCCLYQEKYQKEIHILYQERKKLEKVEQKRTLYNG